MSNNMPIASAPEYIDLSHEDIQLEGQRYSEQPGYAPQAYQLEIIDEKKQSQVSQPTTVTTINYINNTPQHNSKINKTIHFEPEGMIIYKHIPSYDPKAKNKNINLICKSLHDSLGLFKSKSTRIKAFQKTVLTTTKLQRKAIRLQYHKIYNDVLSNTIKRHFNGAFRELLLFSFMSNDELIVNNIEHALKYKNINKLSSILCTLDNNTLKSVQTTFNAAQTTLNASIYHKEKTLKDWTNKVTTNLFHKRNISKYLLKILDGKRKNDGNINIKTVENDVKILYNHLKQATIPTLNKDLVINLFANRSFEHLYYISLKYEQKYNNSLYKTLKSVFKNTSETGYAVLLTLKYCVDKYKIFCDEFAKGIHISNRDNCLAVFRFIMLHHDYDLKNIIEYYGKEALRSWIKFEFKNNDICNIVLKFCGLH